MALQYFGAATAAKVVGKLMAGVLALTLLNDPLSFEFQGQTDAKGQAHFTLVANEEMKDLEVVITGDGQTIRKSIASMRPGQKQAFTWAQKGAQARYELEVTGKGVTASYAFEIVKNAPTGKMAQLQVKSSREDIVKRQTATYQTSAPLERYEYKVYDGEGDVVATDVVEQSVPAGGQFSVKWPAGTDVFMVWVRGEDSFGRFTEYKLVPWSVEIPHTEINFDSGKANIKDDESGKLDEALAVAFHELDALERVNKAVNANIAPRLYIVGYTDTVGSTASNDKLSRNRAKSIAEYFRDKGFWAPIYYAGLGERALRVETGDNVDEVRNRRALYLIGVQDPPPGGQIPAKWTKLTDGRARPAGFTLPPLPERWANYRDQKHSGGSGAPADASDSLPSHEPTQVSTEGGVEVARVDTSPPASDGAESPPPIEGEPGATSKGCSVAGSSGSGEGLPGAALGLFVLLALRRRRAR